MLKKEEKEEVGVLKLDLVGSVGRREGVGAGERFE